jgi:hypothetical protein
MRRLLVLATLALTLAAPAAADDVSVQLTVRGGALDLHVRRVDDHAALLVVRDARGSGAGWLLAIRGGATITGVGARCGRSSTCTLPRLRAPSTRPRGDGVVVRATPGTGLGTIVVRVRYTGARLRPQFTLAG